MIGRKKEKWYKKSIRRNSIVLKDLRQLAKFYQVGLKCYWHSSDRSGYTDLTNDVISVFMYDSDTDEREDIQNTISTVLHEIGHVLNKRNKKYYQYHSPGENYNVENSKYILRHGLNAEFYTEKIGKKLQKLHYPHVPYLMGYHRRQSHYAWYHDGYLREFKEHLKRKK